MSRTDSHQGVDLFACVKQLKGFVRDRCSGVRNFLNPDRPETSTLAAKSLPSQATPTGSHYSASSGTKRASNLPVSTTIGTPVDRYVSREELGRATWLLLHTLAAQYPETPSKQQRKDVTAMVNLITRIYPCGECAEHFESIVRDHAPTTESGPQLRQWMCKAHNAVNQSLGKPQFNCQFVDARWRGVQCEGETACVLFGGPKDM